MLVVNKDNVVEQRKVEIGQLVGDAARDRERARRRTTAWSSAACCAPFPGQKVDPQLQAARAAAAMTRDGRHDLQILHRAAGSRQRHRHPDGRDRRGRALRLPVAQYPDVVPPTVQVTTRYPGASARTVIDTVALPIEQQVNGVEDMIYMQSYAARATAAIR